MRRPRLREGAQVTQWLVGAPVPSLPEVGFHPGHGGQWHRAAEEALGTHWPLPLPAFRKWGPASPRCPHPRNQRVGTYVFARPSLPGSGSAFQEPELPKWGRWGWVAS
jgi:hypothetical protein